MGITKYAISLVVLLLLVAGTSSTLSAQDYPKRTVDGNTFYVYTVEPGNTLFGISRAFSANMDEIKAANPGAADGLEIGQEILIPLGSINRRQARRSEVVTDGDFLLHTVQRKETLFSIAKAYGVTVNDLTELNPEEAQVLSTGSVLRIPVQRSLAVKEAYLEPARNDTFVVHQVAKGETAFGIAQSYGISLDSLKGKNPQILDGLSIGDWLVIPKFNEKYLEQLTAIESVGEEKPFEMPSGSKEVYQLGLMLPFELQENDSIQKTLQERKSLYVLTEIALEFYRGFRLGLDSLEKLGFNAEVHVYDVGEDIVRAKEIMRRPELARMDLVMGPLHKNTLALYSEHSTKHQYYLISPNAFSNEVLADNPYHFKPTASRETLIKYLSNYVAIQHGSHNVIMINSESPKDWPQRKLFKQYYNEAAASFPNAFRDSIASVTKAQLNPGEVEHWLRMDTLNVIVIPSNELAFVSDFLTRLIRLERAGYPIQVYGLDQWIKYDNIEAEYKNRLRLRIAVPNHVDYGDEKVIRYLEKFREAYQMEPSRFGYGFQGFDLALFFGKALLEEGKGFGAHADSREMSGLMGNYRFGRSATGHDFENKSVYILEYNDYTIKKVN